MTGPEKTHAALGASSAHRWMACPGSVRLSRGTSSQETEHSRAGTAAHAVAEMALRRGVDPEMWLGLTVEGVEVDEDMVEAVRVFVDYCRERMQGTEYGIEEQISLADLNPPDRMTGTQDFWAYSAGLGWLLEVVDYKNGAGVVVEVKGNKQLRYYALGTALKLKGKRIDRVKITIIQPNASHPDGAIRSEEISYLELLAFAGELLDAARETLKPDAALHPGSHCRWCPASATCPAQREQVQALAQVAFEAMPLDVPPSPEALPPDVFADILHKLPILEDWAKAMRAHALRKLEAGEDVPGFKLVAKRATRRWKSEAEAVTMLGDVMMYMEDEIFDKKLKSPAQIEKLVGKKRLPTELIESKSSGYTLAPAADKRPALAQGPADAFAALPAGDD